MTTLKCDLNYLLRKLLSN